jgi:hypothetical protein
MGEMNLKRRNMQYDSICYEKLEQMTEIVFCPPPRRQQFWKVYKEHFEVSQAQWEKVE